MKIVIIVSFFCLAILFVLFFLPFKIKIKGYLDFLNNNMHYKLKIFNFKIICGKAYINKKAKLCFENENGKLQTGNIAGDLFPFFAGKLFMFLDVVNLNVKFDGGIKDNPFFSALLSGFAISSLASMFSFLKAKNSSAIFYKCINLDFSETKIILWFNGLVVVSLFDILRSYLSARIKFIKISQNNN